MPPVESKIHMNANMQSLIKPTVTRSMNVLNVLLACPTSVHCCVCWLAIIVSGKPLLSCNWITLLVISWMMMSKTQESEH